MSFRYHKISPLIWKDEKLMESDPLDKLIIFYCLTAQANRIGLFNFSPALAAEDLGLDRELFDSAFTRILERCQWSFDPQLRVLYIPTWFKYNPPLCASKQNTATRILSN